MRLTARRRDAAARQPRRGDRDESHREQRDEEELGLRPDPRDRRDRARHASAVEEDRDGPHDRPARDGLTTRLDSPSPRWPRRRIRGASAGRATRLIRGGEECWAADVAIGEAQPALLVDRQWHRWRNRATAVIARRRCAAPLGPIGDEVGTQPLGRERCGWKDDPVLPVGRTVFSRLRARLGRDRHAPSIVDCSYRGAAVAHAPAASQSPRRTRKNPGDDLFSRKAALSVSSALESLTSVFGMGTGVASPLESPGFSASGCVSAAGRRARICPCAGRRG